MMTEPRVQPIAISSANCVEVTGMSWSWVIRFARAHGVPVWRVGARKQLVAGAQLAEAMAAAARAQAEHDEAHPEAAVDARIARLEARFAARFGGM